MYIPDDNYSTEIKASSSKNKIYGNRSYAQQPTEGSKVKKDKDGYLLAINFKKFDKNKSGPQKPQIRRIRFGWLDHTDWKGQNKPTGQQASLYPESEQNKLIVLFDMDEDE